MGSDGDCRGIVMICMDPYLEYDRLTALFDLTRARHADAVQRGDPSQVMLGRVMQRIWGNILRVRRLAARNDALNRA